MPPTKGKLIYKSERGRAHTSYTGYGSYDDLYENVPELSDTQRFETYRRMRRSDPSVSAAMRSIELPIRQGTFDLTPPSDPTKQEERQAELIGNWLFDGLPWNSIVRSAITSLTYGFAIFEKVYENRMKYVVPKKLGFRPQNTMVDEERNSNGTLRSLYQEIDGNRTKLDRNKLIIFTVDNESPDDWRGQSILRPAYKPWYIKEKMEIVNGIAHERWSGGVPVLEAPETITEDSEEWLLARNALQDIHSGASSYALLPFGWKMYALERKTNAVDPLPFIKELKDDIKTAVLALHLRLGGSDSSGSKALGVAFVDSFLHAVQSWANLICDGFNDDLIRELVDINWGYKADRRYPRLTITNIYKSALKELAYLIQVGVIQPTEELVRYIFEQYGIRVNPKDAVKKPQPAPTMKEDNNNNEDNNNEDNEGKSGDNEDTNPANADPEDERDVK